MFDRLGGEYEEVVFFNDRETGLRAIVAIHSTALGPALGGTRFRAYVSPEEALTDVLRLSRAMTYKAAAAGLAQGGGKAVIIGDPGSDKSEALLRAYARAVDSLAGRYVTAEDVGTTQADMDVIAGETRFVTGTSVERGGSGDPSPPTAVGVEHAMRAAAEHRWGTADLAGRHVVVSGVGKVGGALARSLVANGARVTVADVVPAATDRLRDLGVDVVPAEKAHAVPCDVFSPCALGGVLNDQTVPELACELIVGAANNQLAHPAVAESLRDRGITWVPDYVANAGGIINIAEELTADGYDMERAIANLARIADTTRTVLAEADRDGVTTAAAADRLAERRLAAARPAGGDARPFPTFTHLRESR